jgi:1-aminocyclopropane-1-carboxylate deaminase/D-cysteine desulfhydrase-like pyridoxal-dependent ACC family enzyme
MISAPTTQPAALNAFPRLECGFYPTPLEEMPRLRAALGRDCPRLFIKRDDLIGTGFGSNKVRKLDYAIARETARGAETIVTIAGEKSNHARVTAAVCARLGLRCVLVLNRAENGAVPRGLKAASRFAYEMYGAEIHWVASRAEREPKAFELTAKLGARAAFIPLGVSFPLGALGFARAVQEVKEQFAALDVWPDYIFHASTSGGTQAGLIAGCRLAGADNTNIVGVSPDDPAEEIAGRVAEIVNGVYELLQTPPEPAQITVLDEFIGAGYGVETAAGRAALELTARTEGVMLDPVYTAKAMAALFDWIKCGKLSADDNVLFWHTGGQLAFFYTPE